jgi:hypothetical protein
MLPPRPWRRAVLRHGAGEAAMDKVPAIDPNIFTHVRTIISIIVGLSIGRLLTGLARFVQHPRQQKIYPVHLVWTFFMLVYVIHFWWWEFRLATLQWTFVLYCFAAFYASVFFFLCTMLFPDTMYEYKGFSDYFMSRRAWFFGILIGTFLLDIIDTAIKGSAYVQSLGPEYWVRMVFYVVASILAILIKNQRFQLAYAIVALVYEIAWALSLYDTLV